MRDLSELRAHREEILACARHYGAQSVRVFGSVSRGQAGPDSDVDLLVRFESNRSLVDQIGLIQDLASLLGVPVDVVDETGLSPHLKSKVVDEAVPL
jgi:predicted nucleotidyltransferase